MDGGPEAVGPDPQVPGALRWHKKGGEGATATRRGWWVLAGFSRLGRNWVAGALLDRVPRAALGEPHRPAGRLKAAAAPARLVRAIDPGGRAGCSAAFSGSETATGCAAVSRIVHLKTWVLVRSAHALFARFLVSVAQLKLILRICSEPMRVFQKHFIFYRIHSSRSKARDLFYLEREITIY